MNLIFCRRLFLLKRHCLAGSVLKKFHRQISQQQQQHQRHPGTAAAAAYEHRPPETVSQQQAKILQRYIDPDSEVLEYYEVEEDEEGVDVPMQAELEPYLCKVEHKRPISTLRPDELVLVLRDQRAKNIVCIRPDQSNNNQPEAFGHSGQQCTIICSPFNARHGRALENVVRAFVKRNFQFENQRHIPKRMSKKTGGGWYQMELNQLALHIMEDEQRAKYNLESLLLGLDDEEEDESWLKTKDE